MGPTLLKAMLMYYQHPPIHPYTYFVLYEVIGKLKPIPADMT